MCIMIELFEWQFISCSYIISQQSSSHILILFDKHVWEFFVKKQLVSNFEQFPKLKAIKRTRVIAISILILFLIVVFFQLKTVFSR